MKYKILLALLFLPNLNVYAHERDECYSSDKNSCWFSNNKTQEEVNITCEDGYKTKFIKNLKSNTSASYQFCTGWGDGLGYPEPGVLSKCSVNYLFGKTIKFQFASIDWGNAVDIDIDKESVKVKIKSTWDENRYVEHLFK